MVEKHTATQTNGQGISGGTEKSQSYASEHKQVTSQKVGSYSQPAKEMPAEQTDVALKRLLQLKSDLSKEQLETFRKIMVDHDITVFNRGAKVLVFGSSKDVLNAVQNLLDSKIISLPESHERTEPHFQEPEQLFKVLFDIAPYTGGTAKNNNIIEHTERLFEASEKENTGQIKDLAELMPYMRSLVYVSTKNLIELEDLPDEDLLSSAGGSSVSNTPISPTPSPDNASTTQSPTTVSTPTDLTSPPTTTTSVTTGIPVLPAGVASNTAPTLGSISTPLTFAENTVNAAAQRVQTSMTMNDPDSGDFDTGYLRVAYTGGTASDQLSVVTAGGITTAGANVSYLGTLMGTIISNGVNGADLRINFNAGASKIAVEALIRAIGFANTSNQASATRTLNLTLDDGDGGTSTTSFVVNVTAEADNITLLLTGLADNYVGDSDYQIFQGVFANLSAADTLTGGAGTDTLYFTNMATPIDATTWGNISGVDVVKLGANGNTAVITDAMVDQSDTGALLEIDNQTFSITSLNTSALSASNTIMISGTGTVDLTSGVNNRITIKDGVNASIRSFSGSDTVIGGTGNDTVVGGNGFDSLVGGAGNDTFSYLSAGITNGDTISGGMGTDTFLYSDSATVTPATWANITGIDIIQFGAPIINNITITDAMVDQSDNGSSLELYRSGAGSLTVNTSGVSAGNNVIINYTDTVVLTDAVNNRVVSKDGVNTGIFGGTGNDTIVGGTGSDVIAGGAGADTLSVGASDGVLDRVRYDAPNTGAAAGANTGYDTISQFEVANDRIQTTGSMNTFGNANNIDDVTNDDLFTFATNQATNFNATHEALLITGLLDADLTEANFVNIRTALNGYGITAANAENGLIAVQGATQTAIFYYLESEGGGNTSVTASELSLLGITNGQLGTSNFSFT